jgi:putative glutamine amidotransferase
MSKVIGIPGWSTGDNSFGCTKTYLTWIRSFGAVPRIIMPQDDVVECDMLLLPGGPDINPANYGKAPEYYTSSADAFKEYFYREQLKKYVENGTPIFGICLGFQMLNIFFGGSMEQHLMWHPQSPDRREEGHKVSLPNGVLSVNSHHHQGVLESQVSPEFDVLAVEHFKKGEGGDNKVVESIRHKNLPIAGVQWHPEEWYDDFSTILVKQLLKIA